MNSSKEVKRKRLKGIVVSDKMSKTAVVRIDRYVKHSKYKKYHKISKKFKAHDDNNDAKIGDVVVIEECRPLSKDKSFKIVQLMSKAGSNAVNPGE